MPSLRLFFLFALLVAAVLAAPYHSPIKRSLSKRSFKVPRNANPAIPQSAVSGADAMAKIYRKYNLGFISARHTKGKKKGKATQAASNSTQAATNVTQATNETGSVQADPGQNAALFLSPVKIGGQTLNLDFDSGSSDLWVFSTELSQATIGQHAAFDASKSTSFKTMQNAAFSISYGDGSGAAGTVGTDTVNIGGATVTNQAVELATAVSQSFVQDTNTDGLVGLAFSKLNTVTTGQKATPQKTFFDNIMGDLDQPVFTADLKPDGTGEYEFGTIDNTKFQGDLTWTAVNSSSGFWQFESKAFSVNGKTTQNPQGSLAIADTGTSLLLVDDNVAEAYYSQVQGAELSQQDGGFVYPCNAQLPDMQVAVGSYMATVPGNVVTFAAVDNTNTTCFGGIQGSGGAGMQIFGDVLFRSQFVAFNGQNASLGMANKVGVNSPKV